ncbi:Rap guanine nucleotide exchange factor 2 [Sarcoptes scabiei]|nr:Rap guanine nucleotide exchange factor 2 [Sarcoptes scabiei]
MSATVKREFIAKSYRLYKVLHQHLSILDIDFKSKKFTGFTELQIVSQVDDLDTIRLNCQQCLIESIYLDNYKCEFIYSEPTADIVSSTDQSNEKTKVRKIDSFSTVHHDVIKSTDSDLGNGELIIKVPDLSDIKSSILERKIISVNIGFVLVNPVAGIYFSVNDSKKDSSVEQSDSDDDMFTEHLFTYDSYNSSRLWFPCVDVFSESCTWTILVVCDENFTVISSGDLIEVEHDTHKKKKRFFYQLQIPTSASNIGLVVGKFTPIVNPDMHEVVHFCFPTLKSLLLDTCNFTHRIFEYYEILLNTRYPYSSYKQVFVDNLDSKYVSYATLSIFSINLLHSKHIIDQTYITRRILAHAIGEQYFGCFISMQSCPDAWLVRGIAGFLAHDYYKKAFGNNEYRVRVKKSMEKVIEYEQNFRPIVLDPSNKTYIEKDYFYIKNFHTFSPLYDKMHKVKSFLIMRMLENYLGRELLVQVFNKMLSLAQNAITQKYNSNTWHHLYASTGSFIWAISTVTGKNIDTFLKQWVFQGGHVKITGSFIFNRKRNTVELEIRQLHLNQMGVWRYLGPIMIWLQELDGTFKHTLQIEDYVSKHDLTCHSKSRRNKKKKIPLFTGEEIDMDLSAMDPDSPVLWLRIDPEMNLIREVILEQPDFQWHYQLRYEKDVIAQLESLRILDNYFSNPVIRNVLLEIINNDQVFYRVRCQAAFCLSRVANKIGSQWNGPQVMITLFRKLFGSPSCPHIVQMNNFRNLKLYFLQKAMIVAMAGLRTDHGICPQEILHFLLDLFKYNDNSKNQYSDSFFRASLIDALSQTVTPVAITPIFNSGSISTILSQDTKNILEEIIRFFNIDKLLPSYKYVVTVSCLKAFRHLQKMGHLPSTTQIFRRHTVNHCFIDVRKTAIKILIDIVKTEHRQEDLDFLLDMVVSDPFPIIKYYILKQLIRNPPFSIKTEELHSLDTEKLVNKLWNWINTQFSKDSKLRCAIVDLYFVLYGRLRPRCLPRPTFSVVINLKAEEEEHYETKVDGKTDLEPEILDSSVVQDDEIKSNNETLGPILEERNSHNKATAGEEQTLGENSANLILNDSALESKSDTKIEFDNRNESLSDVSGAIPSFKFNLSTLNKSSSSQSNAESSNVLDMVIKSSSPSRKRKREEKDEKNERSHGSKDKEKDREKHHKDKKKKKKKKKQKHKHKHKDKDKEKSHQNE